MMIRSLIRRVPRVFACAAIVFAAAGSAWGATVSVPFVIVGADNCTSWTLGQNGGTPTLTCVAGGGGPAPFSCNLSGAPTAPIASGTAVNLAMNCSGGTSPYAYAWSPVSSGASSISVNPIANTTYSVTARDSANGTSTQSAAVTISSGGGGGGGGPISCPGFTNTVVLDMNWNGPQRMFTSGMASTDAVVVRFTTGAGNASATFTGAEFSGTAAPRVGILAPTACDFSIPPVLNYGAASVGSTVYLPFTVGPGGGYYAALSPNTTYYLNVKTTAGSCSSCGMYFDLSFH